MSIRNVLLATGTTEREGRGKTREEEDNILPTIQRNILQLFAIILSHQAIIVHHQHFNDVKPLNGRAQLPVVYLVYLHCVS